MAQRIAGRPLYDTRGDDLNAAYRRFALWAVLASLQRFQELSRIRRRGAGWKKEVKEIKTFLMSDLCELYCGYRFTKYDLQTIVWHSPINLSMFDGEEEKNDL